MTSNARAPDVSTFACGPCPLKRSIYGEARAVVPARNPEAMGKEFMQYSVFRQLNPLVKGRRYYLLGRSTSEAIARMRRGSSAKREYRTRL